MQQETQTAPLPAEETREPSTPPPPPALQGISLRESFVKVLPLFIASRATILAVGWLSYQVFEKGTFAKSSFGEPRFFLDLFMRWDAIWYSVIVREGYWYLPGNYESPVAFFPLYPLLVKAVSLTGVDLVTAGFAISMAALLAACTFLHALCRMDLGSDDTAYRAVALLLFFPASLYHSAFFTEGLFLFETVAAFYFARRRMWLAACACGFLASLTRSTGALLLIPVAMEYSGLAGRPPRLDRQWLGPKLLLLPLIPAGSLCYVGYLWYRFGDPGILGKSMAVWGRHLSPPWTPIVRAIDNGPFYGTIFIGAIALLAAGVALLFVQRARWSYVAYALAGLVFITSWTIPESSPRYASVVFPLYMALAAATARHRTVYTGALAASAMLLAVLTALFINGYWMT